MLVQPQTRASRPQELGARLAGPLKAAMEPRCLTGSWANVRRGPACASPLQRCGRGPASAAGVAMRSPLTLQSDRAGRQAAAPASSRSDTWPSEEIFCQRHKRSSSSVAPSGKLRRRARSSAAAQCRRKNYCQLLRVTAFRRSLDTSQVDGPPSFPTYLHDITKALTRTGPNAPARAVIAQAKAPCEEPPARRRGFAPPQSRCP